MVETAEGERVVVAESWIDREREPKNEQKKTEPSHLLDYQGLVRAAELIERIKRRGETETTCQTEASDYDGGQRKVETTSEVKS